MTPKERAKRVVMAATNDFMQFHGVEYVEKLIRDALAGEREECASIAEEYRDYAAPSQMPKAIAAAIRNRE